MPLPENRVIRRKHSYPDENNHFSYHQIASRGEAPRANSILNTRSQHLNKIIFETT